MSDPESSEGLERKVDRSISSGRLITAAMSATAGACLGIYASGADSAGSYDNFKSVFPFVFLAAGIWFLRSMSYRGISEKTRNRHLLSSAFNAVAMMGSYVGAYFL